MAYIVDGFTPEPAPDVQTLEQYVFTETSSLAYGYMLECGLPSLDAEATRAVAREMLSEAERNPSVT